MINILIPMAGKSQYFSESEYPFPKPLIEIGQKTIIEHVLQNLATVDADVQFIFVLSSADCRKFHLDSTLSIITDHKCKIVRLDSETKGAACSALMAISHIANDHPLIIANSDQLFDDSLENLIGGLRDADAGVLTFESVHPRWSYVRLNEQGLVVETAEKRPISRNAIAGLYYFRHGRDFVAAAMRMIQKDSSVNGNFYIAPTLNEMILLGRKIRTVQVNAQRYHTFYTPQKIKEFESLRHRPKDR
ncbi:MAG: glycosyltransferase family 2 protein [Hylemonella sp.]